MRSLPALDGLVVGARKVALGEREHGPGVEDPDLPDLSPDVARKTVLVQQRVRLGERASLGERPHEDLDRAAGEQVDVVRSEVQSQPCLVLGVSDPAGALSELGGVPGGPRQQAAASHGPRDPRASR